MRRQTDTRAAVPVPRALRRVSDAEPGFRRVRRGRGFVYLDGGGRRLRDPRQLARIRSLAIPPAYREVWICAREDGHLQATGIDARGRKQYRYHPLFRSAREQQKFDRLVAFGDVLPRIRRRVARDLRRPGLPREKVLATIVRLLDTTLARVGNAEYAKQNGSFGLATLRDEHAEVRGPRIELGFRGKGGREHQIRVEDAAAAPVIAQCRAVPGTDLFQWIDAAGEQRTVSSAEVNEYLRFAGGGEFTAKDFRTWAASSLALARLARFEHGSRREARRLLRTVLTEIAGRLGNTPAVCRKSYVDPQIIAAFEARELGGLASRSAEAALRAFLAARRSREAADGRSVVRRHG